jgi:hypothetical protein
VKTLYARIRGALRDETMIKSAHDVMVREDFLGQSSLHIGPINLCQRFLTRLINCHQIKSILHHDLIS